MSASRLFLIIESASKLYLIENVTSLVKFAHVVMFSIVPMWLQFNYEQPYANLLLANQKPCPLYLLQQLQQLGSSFFNCFKETSVNSKVPNTEYVGSLNSLSLYMFSGVKVTSKTFAT